MNPMVQEVQSTYRKARANTNYSIFDIESCLQQLAAKGVIWMVQKMKDLTEAESILINHYLSENREHQIYDLDEFSSSPDISSLKS